MQKEDLIKESKKYRLELDQMVEQIKSHGDLNTLISRNWRLKDLLVHISWHEYEMENLLKTGNFIGSPYWELSTNERNKKIFNNGYNTSEAQLMSDFVRSFNVLIKELKAVPQEALIDPKYFPPMPLNYQPWEIIAANTYLHYQDHIKQLRNSNSLFDNLDNQYALEDNNSSD